MARHGDNRSPSPAGSSRRNERRDEARFRDRRNEGRLSYRRSRSPPEQPRYRDRPVHRDHHGRGDRWADDHRSQRRDRSYDRSYDRSRDRSRDRHRPDDRLPERDRRDKPRRDKRDDSRDRHRRRADEARDPRDGKHVESAPSGRGLSSPRRKSPSPSAPPKASEATNNAKRLAKLEEWKRKKAAERENKEREQGAAVSLPKVIESTDKTTSTPTGTASPNPPATHRGSASPAPYAGKFDPKAIAKRAVTSSSAGHALGDDLPVPKRLKPTSLDSDVPNVPSGIKSAPAPTLPASGAIQGKGLMSGFGLASKSGTDAANVSKQALDFGDEENTRKKLEKLPTPPPDHLDSSAARLANGEAHTTNADEHEDDDGDDDEGFDNSETEEEAAAAARAAAERREERLNADNQARQDGAGDISMKDAPAEKELSKEGQGEEEDEDPLDAFMAGLADPVKADKKPGLSTLSESKRRGQQPEAMYSDDDDLTTIDTGPGDLLERAAIKAARRKRDIPAVNHDKVDYEPFQKNFYTEPASLAEMGEEDLANLRLELDGIKVRGHDVPKPINSWAQCGLGVSTLDVIQRLGYESPTSIQCQALPVIMSGRDVIGVAKTGSGKTMAFLLPMFRHIKAQRPVEGLDGPVALIIAPTRELATQIHKDCKVFAKALNLRAVCTYGGAPIKDQIAELKRGADILVCTTGRLLDVLAANGGRVTNLRRVTYTVLDEADRMFDMGFEPQIMKIMGNIRPQRQTVLFSATFPRNMEALARKTLHDPVEIIVGGRSVVAPEITQLVEVRPDNSKFLRLLQLLGQTHEDEDARSLIFVDRQEGAEELMSAILKRGYPCFTIHGGKDQYDRDSVIADFKAGIFPVLVATSVAARGLDVKQLKMVVNFDCPNHLEDYVHRAGRTGRAGQTGLAVTFVTEDQGRYAMDVAKALKQSGQPVPEDLQKLVDSFMEKVKEGKEKSSYGAGFGGKGLERLEADRDAARNRERKLYKTGDEPDEPEENEKKKDIKEVGSFVVHSTNDPKPAPAAEAPKAPPGFQAVREDDIKVHKKEVSEEDEGSRIDKVNSAAAAINSRLRKAGDIRGNAPIDNKGPDAGLFHSTLEINDYPQKARWACTNRTNVARILNDTGTSITTKGEFYPESRPKPGPNDPPKLYILVEGDTDVAVTNAMRELVRSLNEGLLAAQASEARMPASGRYSVL